MLAKNEEVVACHADLLTRQNAKPALRAGNAGTKRALQRILLPMLFPFNQIHDR
jgi:hypothetical protein